MKIARGRISRTMNPRSPSKAAFVTREESPSPSSRIKTRSSESPVAKSYSINNYKNKKPYRTDQDREAELVNHEYSRKVEPRRVLCGNCNTWVKLRNTTKFCPTPWYVHIEKCRKKSEFWGLTLSPYRQELQLWARRVNKSVVPPSDCGSNPGTRPSTPSPTTKIEENDAANPIDVDRDPVAPRTAPDHLFSSSPVTSDDDEVDSEDDGPNTLPDSLSLSIKREEVEAALTTSFAASSLENAQRTPSQKKSPSKPRLTIKFRNPRPPIPRPDFSSAAAAPSINMEMDSEPRIVQPPSSSSPSSASATIQTIHSLPPSPSKDARDALTNSTGIIRPPRSYIRVPTPPWLKNGADDEAFELDFGMDRFKRNADFEREDSPL
ncbi:hypothetical protein SISSUDRAFT_468598 [Sistotremastrum suecicum HHB10207 ss-3]|uniref:Uncharacterized protein n=1 Tax=Sistotremastrum suecicum HHB10207 ss-3 TaxID=1314776 RepID=A0A165Y655_9AGAM|nr:hypothetical protein SISSUDRAFT_468598 [Sistotremastrum suecicum HHB10207 ss-3]